MELEKFETKKEMLWFIQGLKDAKRNLNNNLDNEIKRYEKHIDFMDFKE
jgi:hypothetical protein